MKIYFYSYHKWYDFGFNFIPCIYFFREDNYPKPNHVLGIGWLCGNVELEW